MNQLLGWQGMAIIWWQLWLSDRVISKVTVVPAAASGRDGGLMGCQATSWINRHGEIRITGTRSHRFAMKSNSHERVDKPSYRIKLANQLKDRIKSHLTVVQIKRYWFENYPNPAMSYRPWLPREYWFREIRLLRVGGGGEEKERQRERRRGESEEGETAQVIPFPHSVSPLRAIFSTNFMQL